jgi:hypothetical protein
MNTDLGKWEIRLSFRAKNPNQSATSRFQPRIDAVVRQEKHRVWTARPPGPAAHGISNSSPSFYDCPAAAT